MDDGESSRMSAFASRSTWAARVSLGELSSDRFARVVSGLTTTRAEDGVEYDVDAAAPRTARRTAAIRAPSRSSRASAPVAVRASIRARLASMTPLRASPSRAAPTSPVGTAPHGGGTPAVVRADRGEIQTKPRTLCCNGRETHRRVEFFEPSLNRRLVRLFVTVSLCRSGNPEAVCLRSISGGGGSKQSRRRANSKIPNSREWIPQVRSDVPRVPSPAVGASQRNCL